MKYQRSALGFLWTLLNPLLGVSVLVAVFSYVVRIPLEGYWAFLISGYFAWNFISQSVSSATYVVSEHVPLSRAVAFPAEVPVIAAVSSRLVEFAIELVLVIVILAVFHHGGVPASLILVPLIVLVLVILVLGFVFLIATLAVFYVDVQHTIPVLLLSLFYISPVFYPVEMVPEAIRSFYFLNPIVGPLTLFHQALYLNEWPSLGALGTSLAVALGAFLIGYAVFNRYKSVFAEIA